MADDGLVELVIEYRGGLDPLANLFWVDDNDAEHRYGEVRRAGDVVRQTTFPGHRWLLRGAQTGVAYLQIVASDAPVQRHLVDTGGREDGDGADAVGSWVGEECQFERMAQAVDGHALWRAKDAAGEEVGMLEQTGAYAHTRWLWWADGAFSRWSGLSADRQHLLFCALTLAAAYRLDTLDGFRALIPTPARAALGDAFAAAIGDVGFAAPTPGALLAILILVGAVIAAAVPIVDAHVELRALSNEAREVRLGRAACHTRAPPGADPRRHRAWMRQCAGRFEAMPRDLRELGGRRAHHASFLALVALGCARFCYQRGAA